MDNMNTEPANINLLDLKKLGEVINNIKHYTNSLINSVENASSRCKELEESANKTERVP